MTEHFNGLSEAEHERLAILAEECGEVIQAACKILRHGYESNNKGSLPETNRQALERELGDLQHALTRMEDAGDLEHIRIEERRISKPGHIAPYLHHQPAPAPVPTIEEMSGLRAEPPMQTRPAIDCSKEKEARP